MKLTTNREAVRPIASRFLAVLQIHQEDEHANNVGPLEKSLSWKNRSARAYGFGDPAVSETLRTACGAVALDRIQACLLPRKSAKGEARKAITSRCVDHSIGHTQTNAGTVDCRLGIPVALDAMAACVEIKWATKCAGIRPKKALGTAGWFVSRCNDR